MSKMFALAQRLQIKYAEVLTFDALINKLQSPEGLEPEEESIFNSVMDRKLEHIKKEIDHLSGAASTLQQEAIEFQQVASATGNQKFEQVAQVLHNISGSIFSANFHLDKIK